MTGWEPGLLFAGLVVVIVPSDDPAGLVASSQADLAIVDGTVLAVSGETVTPLAQTATGTIVAMLPATGSTTDANALLIWAETTGQTELPDGVLPTSPPTPTPTPTPTPVPPTTSPPATAPDPSASPSPVTPPPDPTPAAPALPPVTVRTTPAPAATSAAPFAAASASTARAAVPQTPRRAQKRNNKPIRRPVLLRAAAPADPLLQPAGLIIASVGLLPTPLTSFPVSPMAVADPLIAPVDPTSGGSPTPAAPGSAAASSITVASVRHLGQPWHITVLSALLALGLGGVVRLRTRSRR